jgi:ribosomal-protein-alanine N-acetyltransferase
VRFFVSLSEEDRRFFHPHPLTEAGARLVCEHSGADLYYALHTEERILAYGMLRGWDAGFEIPSLGMVVAADSRGRGLGKVVVSLLHEAARQRGAQRIRLKVYSENKVAQRLYRSLGYTFRDELEDGQLVGFSDL